MKRTLPSGWGGNHYAHHCRLGCGLRATVWSDRYHEDVGLHRWRVEDAAGRKLAASKGPVTAAKAREEALQAAQAIFCKAATEAWLKLRVVNTRLPWDGNQP